MASAEQIKTINDFDAEVKERFGKGLDELLPKAWKMLDNTIPEKTGREVFFKVISNNLTKTEATQLIKSLMERE